MGNSSSVGLGSFIDTNSQREISDKPKRSFTRPIKNLYMRRRFPKLSPMVLKNMGVIVSPNCDGKIQRKREPVEQREPSEIDERSKLSLSVVKEELKPKPSKVKRLSRMLAELFPHNELGLKPDPYDIDVTKRLRTTQLQICKEEPSLVESPRKKRKVETSKTKTSKTKVSLKSKKEAKSTPRRRGKRMLLCLAPHNNYSMKDTQLKNTTGRRARAKKDVQVPQFRSMRKESY